MAASMVVLAIKQGATVARFKHLPVRFEGYPNQRGRQFRPPASPS